MTDNVGVAAILRTRALSEAGCCRHRGALSVGRCAVVVAPVIVPVPGATLRVMGTLSNMSDTFHGIPLSEADQAALPSSPALPASKGTRTWAFGLPHPVTGSHPGMAR
jgi:hypothetical protein